MTRRCFEFREGMRETQILSFIFIWYLLILQQRLKRRRRMSQSSRLVSRWVAIGLGKGHAVLLRSCCSTVGSKSLAAFQK
jgi:hypothetical protein